MSRELLILRHAKSDWNTDALTDFERPIAKRGAQDAPRMGRWLRQQGLAPDYVISSPAKRARQTALKVCNELGIPEKRIQWENRIYDADMESILEVLSECPDTVRRVMVVGHNPSLEDLLEYLCDSRLSRPEDGKLLPTATVARLEMPDNWGHLGAKTAKLAAIVRPRSLPKDS